MFPHFSQRFPPRRRTFSQAAAAAQRPGATAASGPAEA